jgi:RING-box protein 1
MSNKFIINNIKVISCWGYNLPSNTDCTICRNNLNESSLYNHDKGIDSQIQKGSCGHSFHSECINPWVIKHKTCPICFSDWSSSVFSFNLN